MAKAKMYPVIVDSEITVDLPKKPTRTFPRGWKGFVKKPELDVITKAGAGRLDESADASGAVEDEAAKDVLAKAKASAKEIVEAAKKKGREILADAQAKADALGSPAGAENEPGTGEKSGKAE